MIHPETIKVKHKDGYMIINKDDFDKEKHQEIKDDVKPRQRVHKKDENTGDK